MENLALINTMLLQLQEKTGSINKNFSTCLDVFDKANIFSGPSVYFHCRTISMLKIFPTVIEALQNTAFLESLYATLTAWGMHRMGKSNTKLVDFEKMRSSFYDQATCIEELQQYQLHDLNSSNLRRISDTACHVVKNL